ncbi:ComF family protein [Neptunicella marina]|uniref:ComF family protein n=1 Tax=Neptunicella marina TaxID=2125989 RepID=A0A8J6ISF5_9ALTE|nr:ComF family protein [Neptunicella marina]MBC3765931.1 ComF family protein [Neptunicella marina]
MAGLIQWRSVVIYAQQLRLLLKKLAQHIPQLCLVCHQPSMTLLCKCCQDDIVLMDLNACDYHLLNVPRIASALPGMSCERLIAIANYQQPLKSMLLALKFNRQLVNAKALADLFCKAIDSADDILPEAIVPVPLHHKRYKQRHYNQAREVARYVAEYFELALDDTFCKRVKYTQAQTELSGGQRRKNLKNAFEVVANKTYQHIAIFDDIITTGSTVNELKRTIQRQYPQMRIDIWCVCISL